MERAEGLSMNRGRSPPNMERRIPRGAPPPSHDLEGVTRGNYTTEAEGRVAGDQANLKMPHACGKPLRGRTIHHRHLRCELWGRS